MTLEELRDYALQLEEKDTANTQLIADMTKANNDLKDDVIGLQRRNNALFLKVEQQAVKPPVDDVKPSVDDKPAEDVAVTKYKDILKI